MSARAIIGLDCSLTGFGLCGVRTDWALRWGKVRVATAKSDSKRPLPQRMHILAEYALNWIQWFTKGVDYDVWTEAVPTHDARGIDILAKLQGVVQHEIYRELGKFTKEVSQSSARAVLAAGCLPNRGKGDAVWSIVQQIAPGVFADHNQGDAFVVCNYALSELGAPFVSVATGKPPRGKKAA